MVTSDFPLERVHGVALASAATWAAVCATAHCATPCLWRGYTRLPVRKRLAWCNRIASALHVRPAPWMCSPHTLLCRRSGRRTLPCDAHSSFHAYPSHSSFHACPRLSLQKHCRECRCPSCTGPCLHQHSSSSAELWHAAHGNVFACCKHSRWRWSVCCSVGAATKYTM